MVSEAVVSAAEMEDVMDCLEPSGAFG